MSAKLWWQELTLREEVTEGAGQVNDVQMSLFNAIAGTVPYKDASYYGEITHPTADLVSLIGKVAVRLGVAGKGSEQAGAVWRLDQGMGGGKSHGLVGMWHLAEHTAEFSDTDIGKRALDYAHTLAGTWTLADDLQNPLCVVLSCDNMTPGHPDVAVDGPAVTLGERCLWRLVERNGANYEQYREKINSTNKDEIRSAIESSGRPVLILIDEVMDYLRVAATDSPLLAKDMAFLRGLLDAANEAKNCVVVLVMIASEHDTMQLGPEATAAREELNALLIRNGQTAAVTGGGDFADIIRRRLFVGEASEEVLQETFADLQRVMRGKWASDVLAKAGWARKEVFPQAVNRCYPFHPSLIELAEQEWSAHTGFQRVRSTIQIFATTVYSHVQRAADGEWVPALIGVGDLPLSNPDVVTAVLTSGLVEDERAVASYREIAGTEIVDTTDKRGTAREKDLSRSAPFTASNPRAAERMGTALFLYSVSPRPRGLQGATEAELLAATFVADAVYQPSDAAVVFAELQDPSSGFVTLDSLPGRGGQPARHYFSTRQTVNMLIKAHRATISDVERDQVLADRAFELVKTGPFTATVRVETSPDTDATSLTGILEEAGIDDARKNRLVVLDPRRFSLLNGVDQDTRAAVRSALGVGEHKLPVGWASSAIFVCVNTQRRGQARNLASEYEARVRVQGLDAVRADEEMKARADQEVKEARDRLDKAIRAAFQHILYLAEASDGTRVDETIRLDGDNQTALHGDIVWAALHDKDKVFGQGEFSTQALLHQLRDSDLGKPLQEVRDAFWNTPRFPLLPSGESELRAAIYGAVRSGELELVDGSGSPSVAHSESEINLQSNTLRLAKPGSQVKVAVPNVVGKAVIAATDVLESAGLAVVPEGSGNMVVSQTPTAGTQVDAGTTIHLTVSSESPPTVHTEFQVKVSTITSIDDQAKRNALRLLVTKIANAIESGASHLQLSAAVTVDSSHREEVEQAARGAGASVDVTEL